MPKEAVKRDRPKKLRIQSLKRADDIIQAIASSPSGWTRLKDISEATNLHVTTTFNLLATLVSLGYVEFNQSRKLYGLGLRNLELGRALQRRMDISEAAQPSLYLLCHKFGETVNLAVPYLFEALIIDSIQGTHSIRATAYAGTRCSYHSTAIGKVILVHFSKPVREAIYEARPLVAHTPHTITVMEKLERQLDQIRMRGFALDNEETELGAACVAASITDGLGQVSAAISISGPVNRLTAKQLNIIAEDLIIETDKISKALGYQQLGTYGGQKS